MNNDELIIHTLSIPSGYASVRLNLKLHPVQKDVVDTLFKAKKSKVSFRAANETGKTSHVITTSILYALEMLQAQVVCTSATFRQVQHQIMLNLKNHSTLYKNWEFLESSIKINGESRLIAFSAGTSDSRFQGFHETPEQGLLVVVDEAAGVADSIFQSISRINPTWLLVAGSPSSPEGVWYSIEHEPSMYNQFHHFKLDKYACLKPEYWLDKQDVDNMVAMWGATHPLILSAVFAEFATNIENGLITLNELDKCYNNPPLINLSGGKHVAIDLAAGGDQNVIAYRNGNEVRLIKSWREKDTMMAARQIIEELLKLKEVDNITANQVSADADGLGLPIIHRLKELGWAINEYHNREPNDPNYKNRTTEIWLEGIKKIKNCSVIIPNDQNFKMQIMSRKQFMHSSGKLMLESKSDMAARGITSPDKADAFFMALSEPNVGLLTKIAVPTVQPRKYSFF